MVLKPYGLYERPAMFPYLDRYGGRSVYHMYVPHPWNTRKCIGLGCNSPSHHSMYRLLDHGMPPEFYNIIGWTDAVWCMP